MTGLELGLIAVAAGLLTLVLVALAVSNRVGYRESVTVHASADRVFRAVQYQDELMAWSAWPAATNSTCRVAGADGRVGTTLEFLTNGKVSGSQTVTVIVPGERVTVALADPSPFGQRPVVTFLVRPSDETKTAVTLDFTNTIRRPFHLVLKSLGVVRWVRELHRKDLAGLKAYCERPPAA